MATKKVAVVTPKSKKMDINQEVRFLQDAVNRYEKLAKTMPSLENERTLKYLKLAHREQEILKEKRKALRG